MQNSSVSSKSYNTSLGMDLPNNTKFSNVNWVSEEYSKSTLREKEWFLEKKLLDQQISHLKSELNATEQLNVNLSNRVKLLETALRREKFKDKNSKVQKGIVDQVAKQKSLAEIQEFFNKNGWINEKVQSEENHKDFLRKTLNEVGISLSQIERKSSQYNDQVLSTKFSKSDKVQGFKALVAGQEKLEVSQKITISAHLDSIRGTLTSRKTQKNSHILCTVSEDCLIKVWEIQSKRQEVLQPVKTLREHTGQLFCIDGDSTSIEADDLLFFTGGSQEFIKVWYMPSTRKPKNIISWGSFYNDQKVANNPDQELDNEIVWSLKYKNKKLLTSASDGCVRLFSINTQEDSRDLSNGMRSKFLKQFTQKQYVQTAIDWVGEEGFISGYQNVPKLSLWDIEASKIQQKYTYETDRPIDQKTIKKDTYLQNFQTNCLKYSCETKSIYSGCEDSKIRIFSYNSSKMIRKLEVNSSISCLDVSRSGYYLMAGCHDGTVKVWDYRTYKLLFDQRLHQNKYDESVFCVSALQKGLVSAGADGLINYFKF